MQKQLNQVKLFMTTFGQQVRSKPELPSKAEMELRIKLLREEVDELEEAFKKGDLVEVADAYTDIRYILEGGVLQCGMADIAEELFDEVQRSNMSKLDENGNVIYREDGKILKSDLYSKPNLGPIVNK